MRPTSFPLTFILSALLVLATLPSPAAEHPRLLLGKEEIAALREKVKKEPFPSMLARMKADANLGAEAAPGSAPITDFDHQIVAHRNAFLYLATGDDQYARSSREAIEKLFALGNWANPNTKGLTLYTSGVYVGLSYDSCYGAPSWDAEFTDRVSKELLRQHDVIFTKGGREQNRLVASNWQALRWSAAGLTLLATDEPVEADRLKKCRDIVKRYLLTNLGGNPETRGWNIEGLGYTYYPFGNGVAPFVIADKRNHPDSDLTQLPGLRMSLWTTYAALVRTSKGLARPDFGDDNPGAKGEGCYGFAFALCPPELLPGIKYWYDRTVGHNGDQTYDNARFGIASSLLYYPAEIEEKDPLTIPTWRNAFVDRFGNGMMTYRNQYKDSSDVVAQIYAKLRGNMGHSGPDCLSFRIAGRNTLWATGGGRYGPKTNGQDVYLRSMNTLYPVDPDERLSINGNPGKILGTPLLNPDGSGQCTLWTSKNNVGTLNHTRRFLSSFDAGADAAFLIADTSDDGKFWQLVTLASNTISVESDSFLITAPNGDTLKGTVLHPTKVSFKIGKRLRGSEAVGENENAFVHFSSDDGKYVVVLTLVAKGQHHPAVSSSESTVSIGKKKFLIGEGEIMAE